MTSKYNERYTLFVSKKSDIQQAAEHIFYRRGFHGVGVDEVIDEAGVSPRTLYRHFASKDDLVAEVLEARGRRYVDALAQCVPEKGSGDLAPLFKALENWLAGDAARGCMFFNALAEYESCSPAIEAVVRDHKRQVRGAVNRYLRAALGRRPGRLTDEIVLLIEGATAQSTISSTTTAVGRARHAAECLVDAARREKDT